LPSGQTLAIHTRTHDEEDLPHATKRYISQRTKYGRVTNRRIIQNDGRSPEEIRKSVSASMIRGYVCGRLSSSRPQVHTDTTANAHDRRGIHGDLGVGSREAESDRGTFV